MLGRGSVSLLLLIALLSGCATTQGTRNGSTTCEEGRTSALPPGHPALPPGHPALPPGHGHGYHEGHGVTHGHGHRDGLAIPRRIIRVENGAVVPPETAYTELLEAKVVYIAERHDNPHHHEAQLAIIAEIYRRDPSLVIGLEMVKTPFQEALDAYVAGQIDESTLLERIEWDERWGFDFELYRGIFAFAAAHGVRLAALNAPDEITRQVARGGLEALSADDRKRLPELDLTSPAHRAMVKEAFEAHHGDETRSFEDFYTAQIIWDETMASVVTRILASSDAPHRVIVLAGDGHIRGGLGIPKRAERRGAKPFRTIIPVSLSQLEETLPEHPSDYLWVMAHSEEDLEAYERKVKQP